MGSSLIWQQRRGDWRRRRREGGKQNKAKLRSNKTPYNMPRNLNFILKSVGMLIYGKFACQRGHPDSVEDRFKRRPKSERTRTELL